MKTTLTTLALLMLTLGFNSCGNKQKEENKEAVTTQQKPNNDSLKATAENSVTAAKAEMSDYQMQCDGPDIRIDKLIIAGKETDGADMKNLFAFNYGGTNQYIFLYNCAYDTKLLESGNVDNKKLKGKDCIIQTQYLRRDIKENKELVTTLTKYDRIPNTNDGIENTVILTIHTAGKSYAKIVGTSMLNGVTKTKVCGKVDMKGEFEEEKNYQVLFVFNNLANNLK